MKIWLIADLHLGDDNIRRYENRPFNDTFTMDMALKRNWNKVVDEHDKVFVLGDVTANKTGFPMQDFNGEKELIMGNHDRDMSFKWWLRAGFTRVHEYPICIEGFYWLSHEPMYMNRNMPYVNIHGHTHGQIIYSRNSKGEKQMINVCADKIGYTPVNFVEIVNRFK